jgi:AcrR family transcriptional regulator
MRGGVMMQRKTEKENTSDKILMTAFECLSARGYANVSMRNIADEAGVALSQLAYHYKNKETLFTAVINMMMEQYLNEIETTLKSTADPKNKLAFLVKYFKELIRDNPKLLRLFIDFTAQALWVSSFREQLDNLFNAITEIIERHLPADTIADKNLLRYSPKCIAKLAFGALFGTSIQIILGSDRDSAFESLNLVENLLS